MSGSQPRKVDWNIVLTVASALIATVSILVALGANRIARESQLARISVSTAFLFPNYSTFGKPPCQTKDGDVIWDNNFVVALDVTNIGGKPASVVKINPDEVETYSPFVSAKVAYNQFSSSAKLDRWLLYNKAAHDPSNYGIGKLFTDTVDYSGLPMSIEAGITRRIVLEGNQYVRIDKRLGLDDIQTALYDARRNSSLTFVLGDGNFQSVLIPLGNPFRASSTPTPFVTCSN